MRCCANCEWSISPTLEDEIMEEQGYDEDDLDRPIAGDCVIRKKDIMTTCCPDHLYCDGTEENFVYYDDKYLGKGYLIIHTVNDEIEKMMKISLFGESEFPQLLIRGYEANKSDSLDNNFRTITFSIDENDVLFDAINNLSKKLNKKVYSTDLSRQGKNNIEIKNKNGILNLTLEKDIDNANGSTDFIDIFLGDGYSCEYYEAFVAFFNELSKLAIGPVCDDDLKILIRK